MGCLCLCTGPHDNCMACFVVITTFSGCKCKLSFLYDIVLTTGCLYPTHRLTEYKRETALDSPSHLEQSPPTPIKPRSKATAPNYSAVNDLAFLPDEVRTPENLEPGQLTADNAQELLDEYHKKRDEYEEAQLAMSQPEHTQEHASPNAPTIVTIHPESREQVFFKPSPGYEDIEIETTKPLLKTTTTETHYQSAPSRSTNGYQDTAPPPTVGSTPRIGDYNNPIDYLPADHFLLDKTVKPSAPSTKIISTSIDTYSEVFDSRGNDGGGNMVILPKVRAMSDSKPVREGSLKKSSGSPSRPGHAYENGPLEVGSSGRPAKSMDNITGFGERLDPIRQSKRDDVKEVVELDFTKKRFRVTSTKRRKDMTDGEISPSGDKKESYAVVNLADKRCYRAESDNIKQEGSGFPSHYGPEAMPRHILPANTAVVTVPT